MLTKFAVTALILILAWLLLFRRPRRRGPPPPPSGPSLPHPLHFARCPRCGVYRQPGAPCDCDRSGGDDAQGS